METKDYKILLGALVLIASLLIFVAYKIQTAEQVYRPHRKQNAAHLGEKPLVPQRKILTLAWRTS